MRFSLYFLLFFTPLFSQEYPKDYFRSPLDIPLQLSGNFGELRSNHFHAGFDFRTQQKEGFNVYASAEGYVSRIKISTYGYGKAIYITHPNGYTTVYGHLRNASPKIENYIKANQYKNESFEIEVFPLLTDLPVKKGEVVAISGNTGGSEGPHLHYEIRDTKTENVINPFFFGFGGAIPDTRRPVITNVIVYPLDENAVVNKSTIPVVMNLQPQGTGAFAGEKISARGKIGFGVNTYDLNNNSANWNGVYQISSFLNGNSSFNLRFDTYHFNETRYLNALIDFSRYKRTGQRVKELFMRHKYPLSVITTDENNGIVNVSPNLSGVYRIEISDFNGNKSTVTIPIEYSAEVPVTAPDSSKTPYFVQVTKDHNYEKDNVSAFFPAGTFYDDFYLDFDVRDSMLFLRNKHVPVHTNFTISIKDTVTPPDLRKQMFIGLIDGKKVSYNNTYHKDNVFTTKVKALGNYGLAKDTIAPTISVGKSIEGKWITAQKSLAVYIKDDLSGIKEYKCYLNGKWALFEYDYKKRKLTHDFNENKVVDGRNELKVVVTDNVGNSAIFETHFFRSVK